MLCELAGVELRLLPEPPAHPKPEDATRYAGTYGSRVDLLVSQHDDGRIRPEMRPKGEALRMGEQPSAGSWSTSHRTP